MRDRDNSMIASLPMYDFPATAPALDAVWAGVAERLRAAGVDAPATLTRGVDLPTVWRAPDLLLGQTCGYPYRHGLQDLVEIVATPAFGFEGCEGATHVSFLVVRRDDPRAELTEFRGARAAINGYDSNTGMNLLRARVAPLAGGRAFFERVVVTGAHVASLAAVAAGEADIAAVDCVTFGLVARDEPQRLEGLRKLGRTPSAPCLPFITSLKLPPELRAQVRKSLFEAFAAPELAPARMRLGIVGLETMPADAYGRIDELEARAAELGYPQLA